MFDSFTHQQVHCTHCGFEFTYSGFGSVAVSVCPACGEVNRLQDANEDERVADFVGETTASPPEPEDSPPELLPIACSVEHCPLLTGDKSGNVIAEQLGLQLRNKRSRRLTILAWTVTLQICVLIGTALFIAQSHWIQSHRIHDNELSGAVSNTETITETELPVVEVKPAPLQANVFTLSEMAAPLPVESNAPAAWEMTDAPFTSPTVLGATAQDFPVSPFEPPHDVSMNPPNMLSAIAEIAPAAAPPLPQPANASTVQTPVPTIESAKELLQAAKSSLIDAPAETIELAVQSAKIYEQLGEPLPEEMYWLLGNAFVSHTWGEPLLESSPAVETMMLSPDSRYLIAQLQDKSVWLWDLHTVQSPSDSKDTETHRPERLAYPLETAGSAEYVKFVFTPDLRWIIGGQKEGTIRVWDMHLNNPAETVFTFTERVPDLQDLQIAPNGQWLAAFGNSPEGAIIPQNHPANPFIQQVNYLRPDRRSVPDSSLYPVLLWDLRQMRSGFLPAAIAIPAMSQQVQVIRFSPQSDKIAVGRRDALIQVYDLTLRGINENPIVLRGHQLAVTQLAFAPNGNWLASGSQDNTVRIWNLKNSHTPPVPVTLYGHVGWISALTVIPSGEYVLSGSYDRTIRIWNVNDNRIAAASDSEPIVLTTSLGIPETILVTQDGGKMIAQGSEGSLGIYHFPTLFGGEKSEDIPQLTFRNTRLSISKSLLTADDQLLIFDYNQLSSPRTGQSKSGGIYLWPLYTQAFVQ